MRIAGMAVMMMCLGAAGCGTAERPAPAGVAATATSPTQEQRMQQAIGPLVERLRTQYAERLAGLYYEHARKRIVVRLTGQTPVAPEAHSVAGDTLQVVFEPGATHSFAQLNQAMTEGASRIAAALPTAHARYVDERSGAIVVAVAAEASDDKAKEAELTRSLGVPVRIESEAPAVLQRPPAQR
jgi:hypothetical protein